MKDQTVQPNAPLQPKEEVQMPGLVGGDKEETTNNNRNNAMTNAPTIFNFLAIKYFLDKYVHLEGSQFHLFEIGIVLNDGD